MGNRDPRRRQLPADRVRRLLERRRKRRHSPRDLASGSAGVHGPARDALGGGKQRQAHRPRNDRGREKRRRSGVRRDFASLPKGKPSCPSPCRSGSWRTWRTWRAGQCLGEPQRPNQASIMTEARRAILKTSRGRWLKRQTTNLIGAFKFAEAIGLPLSVSVDIAWIFFGGTADDRTRFSRLQQRLSKWARRKCFPLTMIWTREIGKNGSPHTHVLLHVPPQLIRDGSFQRALERSLEPEGSPIHNNAILIQQAYRPLGKLLYNLKGVNPKHANDLRIRPAYQGMLSGKRAGCTQNLSAGARYKATTGEVARASSVTPADTLSVTAGNSDIQVQEGRPSASKFSSGDAQSVARGRKLMAPGQSCCARTKTAPTVANLNCRYPLSK
jgi:hypothetical protein